MEQTGGGIENTRAYGRGAEVVWGFQIHPKDDENAAQGARFEPASERMTRPLRILVVDDDADFANVLADYLRLEGHELEVAFDGESAVAKMTERDFDITFMDVRLPGKNGVESFFEIRRLKPTAKVLLMTAYRVEELLKQAIDNGALGVLNKPFDIDQALRALETVKPAGIVLLADDDPDFLDGLSRALTAGGYRTLLAHDGQESVEMVRAGGIDCLLLDLRLPVLSGLEVYLELKRQGHAVPTIIVTGYAVEEAEAIDQLRAMPISGCLVKPIEPSELLRAIEAAVAEPG